jgi:hypothetical protein
LGLALWNISERLDRDRDGECYPGAKLLGGRELDEGNIEGKEDKCQCDGGLARDLRAGLARYGWLAITVYGRCA